MKTIKSCKCGETDVSQFAPKEFYRCKPCRKSKYTEHKKTISEQQKEYRVKNKEKIKAAQALRYLENKEILLEKQKDYYNNNKDKIKKYQLDNIDTIRSNKKRYDENNKDKIREYDIAYLAKNKERISKRIQKYKKVLYQKKLIEIAENKIANGNNGGDWIFYACEFDNGIEHFFKYGITNRDIKTRFSHSQYSGYTVNIHKELYGSEEYIKGLERKVLISTKKDKYSFSNTSPTKFYGKTECRTILDLELIEQTITNDLK